MLTHTGYRGIRFALICALALGVLSAGAKLVSAAPVTAGADAFESDDTYGSARDVTAYLQYSSSWFGTRPRTEWHTFDLVDDAAPETADEDWVKFTVTSTDYDRGYSYLFEAFAKDEMVDPVIEIYGPGGFAPTEPDELGVGGTGRTAMDPQAIADPKQLAVEWLDEGPWLARDTATLDFMPPSAGTFYVRIRPYYQHASLDDPGFRAGAGPYSLRMKIGQMTRVYGNDRMATAIAVSQERFSTGLPDTVLVANAYAFPDALAGSTLAGAVGGPLLLTEQDELPSAVRDEIVRLGANKVYILGGVAAVGQTVQDALEVIPVSSGATQTVEVERIAGDTRYETAYKTAVEASTVTSVAPLAFVANSLMFPDALAASPMATHNVAPILLTRYEKLSADARSALIDPDLGITDVVIVGGTGVVSHTVENHIKSILGDAHVRRIAGSNRYATARDFAKWATGTTDGGAKVGTAATPDALDTLEFRRVGIASGADFPDALAGGVFCGFARAPILLTYPHRIAPELCWPPTSAKPSGGDYWYARQDAILRSYVIGGPGAVRDDVFRTLDLWTGPAPLAP